MSDPFNLQRFVDAQSEAYESVRRELRNGRKEGHWIWFVFPQLKGLGRTATATHFGLGSLEEATAYLAHPVLGSRLRECARLLTAIPAPRPIRLIVNSDAVKVRSSMTLFAAATEDNVEFRAVIDRYFGGEPDERTLIMLGLT